MAETPWIIATDDPTAKTLLQDIFSESTATQPELVRRDGRNRTIRFVQRNDSTSGVLWSDSGYDASSTVEVAIGSSNTPPTSGTFALEFNGDSTGLTALTYNISAVNIATALNANPAISAAGDVTVSKSATDGEYIVVFNDDGAQNLITIDVDSLVPPCVGNVERIQAGDGTTNEIQRVTFKQSYLAYSDNFSASSSGSISVTENQAGSATQPKIQTVTITENVIGGTFTLQASQAQVATVSCQGTTGTVHKFRIVIPSAVSGLNSQYIDLYDASGPVRIWFDFNNTGSAPQTPTGGRLVEVNSAADTATGWAVGLNTALAADSGLDILAGPGYGADFGILLGVKTLVTVENGSNGSASALTVTNTAPSFGSLDQTGFIIYDKYGSVGVWINRSASATVPTGLEATNRLIQVTSIATTGTGTLLSSATQVATAIAAAVDADAEFTATSSSGTVTITNVSAGNRTAPSTTTPYLGAQETTAGYTIAGSFPIDATSQDLEDVFGDIYRVTLVDDHSWQFVAIENGTNATLSAGGTGLVYAPVFTGILALNSWPMALAFAATTDDSIESTLEVQVTEPGGNPIKVLNIPVTIRRDVIDGEGLSPVAGSGESGNVYFLGSVSAYAGAGGLDGVTTTAAGVPRLYTFIHATEGQRWYLLRAGTDADASPAIIRPLDYAASTNEKVFQSVM